MSTRLLSPYVQQPPDSKTQRAARMGPWMFFLIAALAVVLVGLLAAGVTWAFHPKPKTPCTRDCPPPSPHAAQATPPTGETTFTSPKYGFQVVYPRSWSHQDSSGGIFLSDSSFGLLYVLGSQADVQSAILNARSLWNPSRFPNIQRLDTIRGAHVGNQDGQGELLGATYVPGPGGGKSFLVRLPVVAAQRGGVTVLAAGVTNYGQWNRGFGGVATSKIDYVLTQFRWSR